MSVMTRATALALMGLGIVSCDTAHSVTSNPNQRAVPTPTPLSGDYIYLDVYTAQALPSVGGYTSSVTFPHGSTTPSAALAVSGSTTLPQGIPAPSGSNAPGTAEILQAGTILYVVSGTPTSSATDIPAGTTFGVTPPSTIPYPVIAIGAYVVSTSTWYNLVSNTTSGASEVALTTTTDFPDQYTGQVLFTAFGLPSV